MGVNSEGIESPSLIPQLRVPPVNSATQHNNAGWFKKSPFEESYRTANVNVGTQTNSAANKKPN